MTDDMLQWAQQSVELPGSPGVGGISGGDLITGAQAPPEIPDPRLRKPRSRPNRGRKRRYIGPFLAEPPWEILRATGYPIPPDIRCLNKVPSQWRAGPSANKWRAEAYRMWGHKCHICGHGDADSIDHLVPLSQWGNQPYDARLSRPAHGVAGCPTCRVKCNSSRGNRDFAISIRDYKPPLSL